MGGRQLIREVKGLITNFFSTSRSAGCSVEEELFLPANHADNVIPAIDASLCNSICGQLTRNDEVAPDGARGSRVFHCSHHICCDVVMKAFTDRRGDYEAELRLYKRLQPRCTFVQRLVSQACSISL